MRTSRFTTFTYVVLACVLACVVVRAQEQPQSQEKPVARAPEKLVVQVEYFKGAPLAYQSVPGSSWFGRFGLTPAASTRAPADTVLAVDLKTRMMDGRVEIKVGVHVGARHLDSRQRCGERSFLEGLACGLLGGLGRLPPV